jgi:hypothetical protein
MKHAVILTTVVLALGAGGAYYFWKKEPQTPPPSAQVPVEEGAVEQPHQASGKPEIRHPLPATALDEPPSLLPTLQNSDETFSRSLLSLSASAPFSDLIITQDFARRVVATVDNLPRRKVAERIVPVKRPDGQTVTTGEGDLLILSARNYDRYTPYVKLAQAVDVPRLVALYVRHYPLFQQAYEELGYPSKYFNDRLIEALDELLFTPEAEQPVKLVQPKVLYEFADPAL